MTDQPTSQQERGGVMLALGIAPDVKVVEHRFEVSPIAAAWLEKIGPEGIHVLVRVLRAWSRERTTASEIAQRVAEVTDADGQPSFEPWAVEAISRLAELAEKGAPA